MKTQYFTQEELDWNSGRRAALENCGDIVFGDLDEMREYDEDYFDFYNLTGTDRWAAVRSHSDGYLFLPSFEEGGGEWECFGDWESLPV